MEKVLSPDPSLKHKGPDWLRLGSSFTTEERGKRGPRAHEPQTEGKSEIQF